MRRYVIGLAVVLVAPALVGSAAATPVQLGGAPALERRLHFEKVEASSFLFNDWNKFQENYHPSYIGDDDAATAWVEGVKGPGIGEWVRLDVARMQGATQARLRLRNGYQKSDKLFKANARARAVTIVLLPSKAKLQAELADCEGWQELIVPQASGPLDGVEIHIDSAYPGTKYDDLGLSDAQLYVTATTPDNPAFERSHLEALLKWKKERAAAAALFKQESGKTLPIAPQYRVTTAGGNDWDDYDYDHPLAPTRLGMAQLGARVVVADKARLDRWSALLAPDQIERAFTPARVATKDKRAVPTVDGLCQTQLQACDADSCLDALRLPAAGELAWLTTAQLGVFDAVGQPTLADVQGGKLAACQDHDRDSLFTWVHRVAAADGSQRVDAILLARCGAVNTREGFESTSVVQLLGYDEKGRLVVVARDRSASLLRWRDGDGPSQIVGGRAVRSGHVIDVEAVDEVAKR